MTETRESYVTAVTASWTLLPPRQPRPVHPDAVDIIFIDYNSGVIDLAAAAQRVRELIGAAEIASANAALEGWVGIDPDDDGYRCPLCHRAECSH